MKSIRGGMGLGDALYVAAVARHLVASGERLKVCTAWPEVFKTLPVETAPFTRLGINYLAHYSARKGIEGTTQFEDCCIAAGIRESVEFRLDWKLEDHDLAERLRAPGKPIICVQLPRTPMGRTDGFGADLLPNCKRIQQALDMIGNRATKVMIGHGQPLFNLTGIDFDLTNATTVSQVLDAASIAHGFLGYVSFLVPLAESFERPGLFVWSRKGLKSGLPFIRSITPKKVLHRASSRAVVDDCQEQELRDAVESLLRP